MFREAAVVIDVGGMPLYWHVPDNRKAIGIPDSREFWLKLWRNPDIISGIAHTHPGAGVPGPSYEDVTTFEAIESGLLRKDKRTKLPERRLDWWISSATHTVLVRWVGPHKLTYAPVVQTVEPVWVPELRRVSEQGTSGVTASV